MEEPRLLGLLPKHCWYYRVTSLFLAVAVWRLKVIVHEGVNYSGKMTGVPQSKLDRGRGVHLPIIGQ